MAETKKSSAKKTASERKSEAIEAVIPVPYGTAIGGEPDYDSHWVHDTHSSNHWVNFQHNLLVVPTQITVWFSPDGGNTVYPIMWPWNLENSLSPVTVKLTDKTISLAIWSGGKGIHGTWDPAHGWSFYTEGYWRAFAWK